MRIAIHQPYYLPWAGYFNKMASVDEFVYLDTAQFTKGSHFNRAMVLVQGKKHWLTIPVQYEMGTAIEDVKVVGTKWLNKHVKTLDQAYAKSPYVDDFIGKERHDYYEVNDDLNLVQITIPMINHLAMQMNIKTRTNLESQMIGLDPQAQQTDRLIDICKALGATEYLSGCGGSLKYLDRGKMADAGIKVLWQKMELQPYSQVSETFVPGLSVVDLICNIGIEAAGQYVKNCGEPEDIRR